MKIYNKKEIINEIKANLDMTKVLTHYDIQGKGSAYHCPFHEDKKPSLVADPGQHNWKCLSDKGCGSGDEIEFIKRYEKLTLDEAIQKAATIAGVHLEDTKPQKPVYELQKKHYDYLQERGINDRIAKDFGLKSRGVYILFPQQRNNEITGYKGISIKSKKIFCEGTDTKSKLYPDYLFESIKTVIFTAGEFDCIIMTQELLKGSYFQFKAVTNTTGENSYPSDMIKNLKKYPDIEKFMIFYDHDTSGKEGAKSLARGLSCLNKTIEIYSFPEDKPQGYDISDFFNENHNINDLFKLNKVIYKPEKEEEIESSLIPLNVVLPLAPDSKNLLVPPGWHLSNKSVTMITTSKQGEDFHIPVAYSPVFISGESTNIDTDEETLQITFLRNKHWKNILFERVKTMDHKKIIELAKTGFPVTSLNARNIVQFLSDFEAANINHLNKKLTVPGFGWKKYHNKSFYVIGNNVIGSDFNIIYEPAGAGDEKYAKALRSEGTLANWLDTMKKITPYSKAMFALYSSFVAPIADILESPNFIIDFWGETSVGKTTAIEIPASVWGLPVREQGGLVLPWDATKVSIERLATLFNHLPIFLDDSQTAKDTTISPALYMIANGVGKMRGSIKGSQVTSHWRTVCFSTGERPIVDVTEFEGVRSRVIEIFGSPFEGVKAQLIQEIKNCVYSNYGLACIPYMKEVTDIYSDKERRPLWRENYREKRKVLASIGTGKENIVDRLAHYFAAVWTAGELAEKVLSIGGDPSKVVQDIFKEVCGLSSESDLSSRALSLIISWVQSNINYFDTSDDIYTPKTEREQQKGEVYGVYRENEYIAVFPHKLRELFKRSGFSYSSVLKIFSEKNWIQTDGRNLASYVGFRGHRSRMIRFNWNIIKNF